MPKPVLFIPGLLCTGALYRHQIEALATSRDVHVADITGANTMSALAASVLENAPDSFDLVGLSMGGYVSFEILRQAPMRVGKLALIDTSARADSAEQKERRRLMVKQSAIGTFKGVTRHLMPLLIHESRLDDEALTSVVKDMAAEVGRDGFINQQEALIDRIDSRPFLPGIEKETLIIVGDEDQITPPKLAREMAEAIPGARLEVIETCGHLAPLERPAQVTQFLQAFLAE